MLSEKRQEEIDNEFAKVFGADFVQKINDLPEEKTFCCWTLSMCEILKAANDVGVSDNLGLAVSDDNREQFIHDVVDKFKDVLSIMGEEWEFELKGCVQDVIDDWQDRDE